MKNMRVLLLVCTLLALTEAKSKCAKKGKTKKKCGKIDGCLWNDETAKCDDGPNEQDAVNQEFRDFAWTTHERLEGIDKRITDAFAAAEANFESRVTAVVNARLQELEGRFNDRLQQQENDFNERLEAMAAIWMGDGSGSGSWSGSGSDMWASGSDLWASGSDMWASGSDLWASGSEGSWVMGTGSDMWWGTGSDGSGSDGSGSDVWGSMASGTDVWGGSWSDMASGKDMDGSWEYKGSWADMASGASGASSMTGPGSWATTSDYDDYDYYGEGSETEEKSVCDGLNKKKCQKQDGCDYDGTCYASMGKN